MALVLLGDTPAPDDAEWLKDGGALRTFP